MEVLKMLQESSDLSKSCSEYNISNFTQPQCDEEPVASGKPKGQVIQTSVVIIVVTVALCTMIVVVSVFGAIIWYIAIRRRHRHKNPPG